MNNKALVLFSGGQDSTACLAWALSRFDLVETIGFNYGQRHVVEMQCRQNVLQRIREDFPAWALKLGEDKVIELDWLGQISDCSLTRDRQIELETNGLPSTFVPGRNLIFFLTAAALAYRRGLNTLVGGMCQTDFSGYPDCRQDTLKALETATNLGMDTQFEFELPLMWIDKAETFKLCFDLGGQALLDIVLTETHSCYLGDRSKQHSWGFGCGTCPACELRKTGWEKYAKQ